jgi:hypothetical protein
MIAKAFGIAAATVLLAFNVACAQTSKSSSAGAQTSKSGASTSASAGASGPAEMGRGRCEALTGAERDKCFAEERGQRSDARK